MTAAAAFTGARLDRAGDGRRRDPGWVEAQRADPAARAVLAGSDGVVMAGDALAVVPLAAALGPGATHYLLGRDDDGPLFAVDVDAPEPAGGVLPVMIAAGGARGTGLRRPARAGGQRPVPLREAVAVLAPAQGGLVAYAAALLNWHRRHPFCAACGHPTQLSEAGLVRLCPSCGGSHHPRTDPVVIMLVTRGDRVLLGRAPGWPPRRYSALAGFVEPGESLEEAVAREVLEESGVQAAEPRYVSSQPWPFPGSLMLGFEAVWAGGEPEAREEDIQDVRWFDRDEVAAAAAEEGDGWGGEDEPAGRGLLLPPRFAIARRLLDGWLGWT